MNASKEPRKKQGTPEPPAPRVWGMPRRIRIAYFIDRVVDRTGGTEQQLLLLLEALDRSRFQPFLLCLRPSHWLSTASLPCEVAILNVRSILSPSLLTALRLFRQLQTRHRFDMVHTLFFDASIVGTLLARFCGIRTVISSRRNIGDWQTSTSLRVLRAMRPWTTHYIANSRAAREHALRTEGIPPDRISVIYNALDARGLACRVDLERERSRELLGLPNGVSLVLSVANLRSVKNIASLIKAASLVTPRVPNALFVVLGEGPERSTLEDLIHRLGLDTVFMLPGSAQDVVPYLAAADLAVQCSRAESLSNALIEYMAAGLPIVASDVGGNSEAITHGATGLLYRSDDVTALADEMTRLLRDRRIASRLGKAARARALNTYSIAACIHATEDCYERVFATAKSQR